MRSALFYDDYAEELMYLTRCNANDEGCGWVAEEYQRYQGDCVISVCPECGCDDVKDESEWV
jgi:hypothetical protein